MFDHTRCDNKYESIDRAIKCKRSLIKSFENCDKNRH